ncbi:unnamed protein product [Rhizopus stolonifer]
MVPSVIQTTSLSQLTLVNPEAQDETFSQLIRKLDKGTETVAQLRTLLTVKTAELNQLVQQLQMIDEVLTDAEYGTEQVENVLKEVKMDRMSYAALDPVFDTHDTMKKTRCEDSLLINKLKTKLKQLGIDPIYYFRTSDDSVVLQKAVIDLDIAKTISLCIKSDYKQRSTLMKNKNAQDQIQQLGDKIREELKLWKMYTRDASFSLQNKDIEYLLHVQDQQLSHMKKTFKALYTRHTSSSMAKLNNSSSLLKLRKLIPSRNPWLTMAKVVVQ